MLRKAGVNTVDQIVFERGGWSRQIAVRPVDCVFVTLGSMTEGSSLGSMDAAPLARGKGGRRGPGVPGFSDHADQSTWISFTTTMRDPTFCTSSATSPATFLAKAG